MILYGVMMMATTRAAGRGTNRGHFDDNNTNNDNDDNTNNNKHNRDNNHMLMIWLVFDGFGRVLGHSCFQASWLALGWGNQ